VIPIARGKGDRPDLKNPKRPEKLGVPRRSWR
jgi:hypothetical protein